MNYPYPTARPVVFAAQDEAGDSDADLVEDVIFYGDVQDAAADEQDAIAVVPGRSKRSLGLVTAGAALASHAANAVGPSLAGAAAITSGIKPLVWGGLGTCEYM